MEEADDFWGYPSANLDVANEDNDRRNSKWYPHDTKVNTSRTTGPTSTSYYVAPTEIIDFAEVCLIEDDYSKSPFPELPLLNAATGRGEYASGKYASHGVRQSDTLPFRRGDDGFDRNVPSSSLLSPDESFVTDSYVGESVMEGGATISDASYCDEDVEHVTDDDESIEREDLTDDDGDNVDNNDEAELMLDELLDDDSMGNSPNYYNADKWKLNNSSHRMKMSNSTVHSDRSPRSVFDDPSLGTNEIIMYDHDPYASEYHGVVTTPDYTNNYDKYKNKNHYRVNDDEEVSHSSTVSSMQLMDHSNHTEKLPDYAVTPQKTDMQLTFSPLTSSAATSKGGSSDDDDSDDEYDDYDAKERLERAHERLERQRLQETVESLREMLEVKNDEIEILSDQLRRAVTTKCDLVLAHAELEHCHESQIIKKEVNVKELKKQNCNLLEEYSVKEKELLTELITLSNKIKDDEIKYRNNVDEMERKHRNQILEKDFLIAQLTVELQTSKMKYNSLKQQRENEVGDASANRSGYNHNHLINKIKKKTNIKKIFHTQ
jgi:hypothetical protein